MADHAQQGMGLRRLPGIDSCISSRRQPTSGSEFCPLGHFRDHRDSHLAADNVLRNDRRGVCTAGSMGLD